MCTVHSHMYNVLLSQPHAENRKADTKNSRKRTEVPTKSDPKVKRVKKTSNCMYTYNTLFSTNLKRSCETGWDSTCNHS